MQREWRIIRWIRWLWFTRGEEPPTDARLAILQSELYRIDDKSRRESVSKLLEDARSKGGDAFKLHVARNVRRYLNITSGPTQFWAPALGFFVVVAVLPSIVFGFLAGPFDDVEPLGLGKDVFFAILFAGGAGGVVRVLRLSAGKNHHAESGLGLFFGGIIPPLLGMILAVAAVAVFHSGFVDTPISDRAVAAGPGWSREEVFLVLAGFTAGLSEGWAEKLLPSGAR